VICSVKALNNNFLLNGTDEIFIKKLTQIWRCATFKKSLAITIFMKPSMPEILFYSEKLTYKKKENSSIISGRKISDILTFYMCKA
jgi:hypothetical protein